MNIDISSFYNHQMKYYTKLEELKEERFHSIICIPTGGGKTRLAVIHCINNEINRGRKILWLTHSKYLLNQAYYTFMGYLGEEWMRNNAILIHSDTNQSSRNIQESHQLVLVSFQSLIRCTTDWKRILGSNVTILVDEAHHVIAESYMNVVKDYAADKKVLGLTATPVRSKINENNELYNFFETDLGIRVHISSLFEEHILVRPLLKEVEFVMDTNDIYSIDDLNNSLIREIQNYNMLIFDHFKKFEKEYGKTVIFAINKEHVDALYEMFCSEEAYRERTFRVYSDLNDRERQFEAFTKSKDGILININIMNEGVDIPDIQTVFMTKPLNSKITVTQIIGRALRKAEGKKNAYIVNFAVSNIGSKFMLVSPTLSYKLYKAEWNYDDEELEDIERDEENINSIARLVKEHIEKKAVCSFSNVCLAGHYTVLDGDEIDIPIPVSFLEYRKIEQYIQLKKNGKEKAFPTKLFFCEDTDSAKMYIDKAIANEAEIDFSKYDCEIFEKYEGVYQYAKNLYERVKCENLRERQVREEISSFYKQMADNGYSSLQSYLSMIGANTENQFVKLIRNEFVYFKYE